MPTYGAWPSPLTAARVTAGTLRLDQIQLDGDDVYWLEGRASEGGRNVIVKAIEGPQKAQTIDITPPGFNVRTRVHEYGGAAYTVHNGAVYFSNFADQRVYRQEPGQAPVAMTEPGSMWADCRVDAARHRLIGVREHPPSPNGFGAAGSVNSIAAIPERTLVEGADFYSDPI